jgi:hypothetical protein
VGLTPSSQNFTVIAETKTETKTPTVHYFSYSDQGVFPTKIAETYGALAESSVSVIPLSCLG